MCNKMIRLNESELMTVRGGADAVLIGRRLHGGPDLRHLATVMPSFAFIKAFGIRRKTRMVAERVADGGLVTISTTAVA